MIHKLSQLPQKENQNTTHAPKYITKTCHDSMSLMNHLKFILQYFKKIDLYQYKDPGLRAKV